MLEYETHSCFSIYKTGLHVAYTSIHIVIVWNQFSPWLVHFSSEIRSGIWLISITSDWYRNHPQLFNVLLAEKPLKELIIATTEFEKMSLFFSDCGLSKGNSFLCKVPVNVIKVRGINKLVRYNSSLLTTIRWVQRGEKRQAGKYHKIPVLVWCLWTEFSIKSKKSKRLRSTLTLFILRSKDETREIRDTNICLPKSRSLYVSVIIARHDHELEVLLYCAVRSNEKYWFLMGREGEHDIHNNFNMSSYWFACT